MGVTNPSEKQPHCLSKKKLLSFGFYSLISISLINTSYFPTTQFSLSSTTQFLENYNPIVTTTAATSSSSSPSKEEERAKAEIECDYNNGKWVPDTLGPIYNGTCGAIIDPQNCMGHGRPDLGYLYWRWKPNQCNIPRFEPEAFLQILRNKHLAFVGDSLARNQLESLLCMLATVSTRHLVYSYSVGERSRDKFRRWHFPSHNFNVSIYWSPFLVHGKTTRRAWDYNRLYLDSLDEQWTSDLDQVDMIVISFGRWFFKPSLYLYGNSTVLGCHRCTGKNHTEVKIYDVLGKILNNALEKIMETRGEGSGKGIDVIVATFSPDHFEGEWDKFGSCPKTLPFKEGEKQLVGIDAQMRRIQLEEVEAANKKAKEFGKRIRFQALDVTKLSLMRGDGHPGPYRVASPFANEVKGRVKNDCTHWCLPGPVDTWNEILLDIIKRWEGS